MKQVTSICPGIHSYSSQPVNTLALRDPSRCSKVLKQVSETEADAERGRPGREAREGLQRTGRMGGGMGGCIGANGTPQPPSQTWK